MYTDGSVLGCWECKIVAWETGVVFKEEIEEPQTTQQSPPRHDVPSIGTEVCTEHTYVYILIHKSCPDVSMSLLFLVQIVSFFGRDTF